MLSLMGAGWDAALGYLGLSRSASPAGANRRRGEAGRHADRLCEFAQLAEEQVRFQAEVDGVAEDLGAGLTTTWRAGSALPRA